MILKRAKFSFHIYVCISTLFKQRLISINSASPSLCDSVCMYVRKRKWTNVKTKETFTARERNKERFLKLMGIITSYAAHNNITYINVAFEYSKQFQCYATGTIGSPLFSFIKMSLIILKYLDICHQGLENDFIEGNHDFPVHINFKLQSTFTKLL